MKDKLKGSLNTLSALIRTISGRIFPACLRRPRVAVALAEAQAASRRQADLADLHKGNANFRRFNIGIILYLEMPLIIILVIIYFSGCNGKKQDTSRLESELIGSDMAFSDMSKLMGTDKAFEAFAHDEAVFLKPNRLPIEGKEKVLEFLHQNSGQPGELTWKPLKAIASNFGDLGYTYGIYQWKSDSIVHRGTYLTIWKKDKAGAWKYVLDTGNPGLGE